MVSVSALVQAMVSGLATGMMLFIAAVGLTLVFGVLDILNFAHGSLYMLGGYSTFFLISGEGIPFVTNFWVAIVLSAVIVAIFGAILERVLLRRIYDNDHIFQLLLTFGLVLLIDNSVRILWGTGFRSVDMPASMSFTVELLGSGFPAYNLFLIGVGVVLAVGMWLLFEFTKLGKIVRASAEDRAMSESIGNNVPIIFTLVFLFGSALAGFAGALVTPLQPITPSIGETMIIEAFIIVVIGGLGSFAGALVGSLLLGLVGSLAFLFVPSFQPVIPFALLAAVIILRPAGLFGEVRA